VTDDPSNDAPSSATFRLVVLVALALLLIASSVALVVLHNGRKGAAADEQAQRETLMNQTQQFILRLNTYGPDKLDSTGQMPTYRADVKAVITPKFAASFDQSVNVAEQSVKQYGLARTCAVFGTGVEVMDSDSAQVLVAGSFSQTYKDAKGKTQGGGEPTPFRLRVSLVRIGAKWLVDDYGPAATEASK
jgi:Mce-associated membrane protein